MLIVGVIGGYLGGLLTAIYAPRVWSKLLARAKSTVDRVTEHHDSDL